MGEFMHNVQTRFKTSSAGIVIYLFRILTGLFLGLCLAIIGKTIIGFGDLAFWFVLVMSAAVFLRISKGWGAWGVVIFNLVVFLSGLLLRLYIQIAPGE